jgi:hypothetical protein
MSKLELAKANLATLTRFSTFASQQSQAITLLPQLE